MKEFQNGDFKYTSTPMILNGVAGRMWTKWEMDGFCWVKAGSVHMRCKSTPAEIECAFRHEDVLQW